MSSERRWLVVIAMALLPACGDDTGGGPRNDGATDVAAAKDTLVTDAAPDSRLSPDAAPDQAPAVDLAADLPAVEAGLPDLARPDHAIADMGRAEVPEEARKDAPDAALDVAGEAGLPPSYACRNDSDCCIVIETCSARAYLYSIAPGATGRPALPPPPSTCLPCIPPAVQVHCDQGQCVGEKVSGLSSGALLKDHCGPVARPDGGALLYDQPAYQGAPQTSWGC